MTDRELKIYRERVSPIECPQYGPYQIYSYKIERDRQTDRVRKTDREW